jgi:23S rRNA (uracil1939-C5)-methyltransferase
MKLQIERLAVGGDGIARNDGKIVFVPGALVGESVTVRIVEDKARYARAELLSVETPSADRRDLDCTHETDNRCGGCGFRHVVDARSLALKAGAAIAELRKLAPDLPWPAPNLHLTSPMDPGRERLKFHVRDGELGLFERGSHDLVKVPNCLAAPRSLVEGAEAIQAVIIASGPPYPSTVLIEVVGDRRYAFWQGQFGDAHVKNLQALVDEELFGGIVCRTRKKRVDMGATWIDEDLQIGGRTLHYRRRVGAFAQANPIANQLLREQLYALLEPLAPERTIDLYAGSGNLTLIAALISGEVLAVEVDRGGIKGLAQSAERSGLDNIEAIRADLRKGLDPDFVRDMDVALLDPPRDGAKEIMSGLVEAAPGHIIYVSCSPPHLARDARYLERHYSIEALEAFDMFPRTPHLELLAHFKRLTANV